MGRGQASSTLIYNAQSRIHHAQVDMSTIKSSPEIARYRIRILTARAATVSVATYAQTKLQTKVMT